MKQKLNRIYLIFKVIFITIKSTYKALFLYLLSYPIFLYIVNSITTSMDTINIGDLTLMSSIVVTFGIKIMSDMCNKYKNNVFVNTLYMVPASINEKYFVMFFSSFMFIIFVGALNIINVFLYWLPTTLLDGNDMSYIDTIRSVYSHLFNYGFKIYLFLPFFHSTVLASCMLFRNNIISMSLPLLITIPPMYFILLSKGYDYQYSFFDVTAIISLTLIFWAISYIKFRKIQLNK